MFIFTDYWKLEDVPPEESSDSSDNTSIAKNLSKDVLKSLEKDVDITSDSSDDEYIPSGIMMFYELYFISLVGKNKIMAIQPNGMIPPMSIDR